MRKNKSIVYISLTASLLVAGLAFAQDREPGFNGPQVPLIITEDPGPFGDPGLDDLTPISNPDTQYTCRTTLFDITVPDLTSVSSLTAGGCTVSFTPALQARTVGQSWATWGSPPFTESSTPRILYTNGATSFTMQMSAGCASMTIGFEAEPNPFDVRNIMGNYFAGAVSQGTVSRPISGQAGARLIAADSTTPVDRVVVSSNVDFAVGRIRYQLPLSGTFVNGYVRDADGNGIAGARVRADGFFSRVGFTDQQGRFSIEVTEDNYTVTASSAGFMSDTVPNVWASLEQPAEVNLSLIVGR